MANQSAMKRHVRRHPSFHKMPLRTLCLMAHCSAIGASMRKDAPWTISRKQKTLHVDELVSSLESRRTEDPSQMEPAAENLACCGATRVRHHLPQASTAAAGARRLAQ